MHPDLSYGELLRACRNKLTLSEWFKSLSVKEYAEHLDAEVHEIIQALERKDVENLKEELGDVFWVIHALILKAGHEHGFGLEDVISGVLEKFKRRKPHIFNGVRKSRAAEIEHWHRVKKHEKEKD